GRLDGYIAQTERMRQLAAQWGIDVPLSNHPGYDGTVAKLKARAAAPAAPTRLSAVSRSSIGPCACSTPARARRRRASCSPAQVEQGRCMRPRLVRVRVPWVALCRTSRPPARRCRPLCATTAGVWQAKPTQAVLRQAKSRGSSPTAFTPTTTPGCVRTANIEPTQ
ncbi:MAG: hypothetical protein KAY46_00325, partial [Burkholderiaceae bacterium]|nr:hypothetical protein [Burkholderiaceae bacterium]